MALEDTNPPAPANANPPAKTYTEAELNSRIEQVRTEEKTKLYGEINALKEKLTAADLTVAERNKLAAELKEAQGQLAAVQKAQGEKGFDPVAFGRQVAQDTRDAVKTEFGNKLDQMQQQLTAANEQSRKVALDAHRQNLIAAANGRTIKAMIVGNTTEELNAAAVEAARQYEEIASSANPNGQSNQQQQSQASAGAPPSINARPNGGGLPKPPGLESFERSANPADYGKNRAATLAAVRKQFG